MSRFVPFCAREKSLIAKLAPLTAAASPSLDTATPVASEFPELEAATSCSGVRGLSTSPSASSAKAACAPPNASTQATARRDEPSHANFPPLMPQLNRAGGASSDDTPLTPKRRMGAPPILPQRIAPSRDTHVIMPIG